jgi:HK97 family phage portal protein
MGLKEAWKALFNNQIKEGPVIAYSNIGTQTQPKESYSDLAREGYQENAIVYRCINEISNGASAVKFHLMRGDQPIDDHPLIDLLMKPNPINSQSEFFQEVYSYLLLSGNSYILKTGPDNRLPTELHTLRPDRMRIVPSKREIPDAYQYVVNGQVSASYQVNTSTGESDVKQIKLFNPLNDHYGLSPLKAASVDIDQHNLANKHNVMLLMNGARPSGAVVYRPKDEQGTMTMLTDSQREQLRNDLSKRFEGSQNSGRTMILEGDFDYKEMGLTPKDMDFTGMKILAQEI